MRYLTLSEFCVLGIPKTLGIWVRRTQNTGIPKSLWHQNGLFALKLGKLFHIMRAAPIVEIARAFCLRPRLWQPRSQGLPLWREKPWERGCDYGSWSKMNRRQLFQLQKICYSFFHYSSSTPNRIPLKPASECLRLLVDFSKGVSIYPT